MKNIFTLFILSTFVLFTQAQELPNNGFEAWENIGSYEEPESWNTPNQFTSLLGKTVVTKSEDAASGAYAARLESTLIEFLTQQFKVPGLVTYADFDVDIFTQDFTFGGGLYMPYRVQAINGKYKYSPAEEDTATVLIYSFAHPEGEDMDTIGIGYGFLGAASEWTDFSFDMVFLNDHTPDTFNVLLMSTNSFVLDDIPVGSVFLVDDITVETSVGIFNLNGKKTDISVFPNPAADRITFVADEKGINRSLKIFDLNGREVRSLNFNSQSKTIGIGDLPNGHYTYILQEGRELLNSGSFIKR